MAGMAPRRRELWRGLVALEAAVEAGTLDKAASIAFSLAETLARSHYGIERQDSTSRFLSAL
jgi:hypothetical protein